MTLIMEEPDNPLVQSVQQSLSVQCSPSKTDAATQTDIETSDAAVQWPGDVHYPVTTDYVYTALLTRLHYQSDLEGRSRRNNLRLVGIPEDTEGPRPTEFISRLLKKLVNLDEEPLLDRAHRTLRTKPKEGETPQPFVIRVHFFHVRNEILRGASTTSRDTPLLYKGKRLSIFPDYTAAVSKKRATFGGVKRELCACPGVKFGLMFPAVLKIALPGGATHKFEDPAITSTFINIKLKKLAPLSNAVG
ncbi:hypothetical protein SKAU_G00137820 [Synaphobranchus kaupii]|uniref:Uncharacterized protein n=1 Tax=Synaphobranchus kaupii TaxID=118154 RepID=A0A9Q1FSA7_SYNKA|nr:hypothetical protein SKAU_G00137820 [Synaphobranchus kaupii]